MSSSLTRAVTETHEAFGSWVPGPLAAALRDEIGSEPIIGQTEILAVVAAKIKWHDVIAAKARTMVVSLCRASTGTGQDSEGVRSTSKHGKQ